MQSTHSQQAYLEAWDEQQAQLPGRDLPWLRALRQTALDRFAERGFPGARDEAWKYTRLDSLSRHFYPPARQSGQVSASQIAELELTGVENYRLVFVDGYYQPTLSRLPENMPGVRVGSLGQALDEHPQELETHLGRCADLENDSLAALNTALFKDGAYLRLESEVVLETPVHLLFVQSGEVETLVSPRCLIVMEAGSRGMVVEHYLGLGGQGVFSNGVTEIMVGENSHLIHYNVQEQGEKSSHLAGMYIRQAGGSRFDAQHLALGARLSRQTTQVSLEAEQAACALNGLYLLGGRQHADQHTRIEHRSPHCRSEEFYKGVLDDYARGVFTGRVVVSPDAQHSDARQTNHNLLLSGNAEADARPQLEIHADDVQCSHGATVGQLDETALFYLRSRGISEELARGLLIHAFASEVLAKVEWPALRLALEQQVLKHLPKAANPGLAMDLLAA